MKRLITMFKNMKEIEYLEMALRWYGGAIITYMVFGWFTPEPYLFWVMMLGGIPISLWLTEHRVRERLESERAEV